MRLTHRQLEMFQTLLRTLSVTETAQELASSQPTISRELKALVGGLEPQRTYEAVLEGAVSAEALRNGGDKESRTYNRWIADRRMDRVADWLRQNVGRSLSITHGYVENDSSRRVTVRLRPVP